MTEQRLYMQYGDPVAQPRMLQALQQGMANGGNASGASATPGQKYCAQTHAKECSDLYAKWYWDPKHYFSGRDSAWMRSVAPPALQNVDRNKVTGADVATRQP